jgi:hypothetical protein
VCVCMCVSFFSLTCVVAIRLRSRRATDLVAICRVGEHELHMRRFLFGVCDNVELLGLVAPLCHSNISRRVNMGARVTSSLRRVRWKRDVGLLVMIFRSNVSDTVHWTHVQCLLSDVCGSGEMSDSLCRNPRPTFRAPHKLGAHVTNIASLACDGVRRRTRRTATRFPRFRAA